MLPEISVEILGPISSLKGYGWARGYDWVHEKPNQPLSQILVDEPHELVIHLPGGRIIRHISRATFFKQERSTVIDVSLMPHPGLLRYQDALKLLDLILEQWDAEPDERTKESLRKWRAEGDLQPWALARRAGGALLHGEKRAVILFEVRPDPNNEGWFLSLTAGASADEVRRLWNSHTPARSQPATKGTAHPQRRSSH